jgi:hypothetical protein
MKQSAHLLVHHVLKPNNFELREWRRINNLSEFLERLTLSLVYLINLQSEIYAEDKGKLIREIFQQL